MRKGLVDPTPTVLIRCDGSAEIGLGHVVRCLALADELQGEHQCKVMFAVRQGPVGFGMLQEKGYSLMTAPDGGHNHGRWLEDLVSKERIQALVLDVRDDTAVSAVQSIRSAGVFVVTLDDPSERRLAADLAFYPPVPQVQKLDWAGFTGKLFVGWEWVLLRPQFAQPPPSVARERPVVLVTMGGSDPAGLTLRGMEALDFLDQDFDAVVVLGPGFSQHRALSDVLTRTRRHFDVRHNVADMVGLMAQADLAVASFGITAYELAAMGVPAIYLCLTQDHVESASALVEAGMGVCLGVFTDVPDQVLAETVRDLLNDVPQRLRMAGQARQKIDGQGVWRIAHIVAAGVESRNG